MLERLAFDIADEVESLWEVLESFSTQEFQVLTRADLDFLMQILEEVHVNTLIRPGEDMNRPPQRGVSWASRPRLRAAASRVAERVYQFFREKKRSVPSVLKRWHQEALKDPLPEVRQPWRGGNGSV